VILRITSVHDSGMSNEVALRPVREDDLASLEDLTQNPQKTGAFEWFGWADLRRWRRGWDENGLIGPDGGTLIVTSGDQRLGMVNWRRQPITVPTSYYWEIGIALLPEARGRGYGTQAQRLPCAEAASSSGRVPAWQACTSAATGRNGAPQRFFGRPRRPGCGRDARDWARDHDCAEALTHDRTSAPTVGRQLHGRHVGPVGHRQAAAGFCPAR
jgi:Acetyltransferase (GNAT) domain